MALDAAWRFSLTDVPRNASADLDDAGAAWRTVDLPHDWSVESPYGQNNPAGGAGAYLPGGVGWYRRAIDIPAEWLGRHAVVEFDAANRNSDVYLNGRLLGHRPYGYISFAYDLTPHLRAGRNVLAVRLDDSQVPMARWYMGCGLYAHVRLVVTDRLHVGQWGTFVTTPQVTPGAATVHVRTEIVNDSTDAGDVRVSCQVLYGERPVASAEPGPARVNAGQTVPVESTIAVPHPRLWSPEAPHLYTLVTRVLRGDVAIDECRTDFGIRTARWDADTGFWLNDQNVKLDGLGMHYDAGGALGAAIPDDVLGQRLRQLKEMGLNAVRTGHTPFPPRFYDLCDRLGLMVIDEAFDGWRKKAAHDYGALDYKEWWRRDLSDLIRRDRNHPCVIAWSLGNETGRADVNHTSDVAHALDPTRATTGGQLLDGVDVSGFTGQGESPGVLEAFHQSHPHQPILLIEETHAYATRGFYRALTWWRDPGNVDRRVPFPAYASREVFTSGGDPQYNSAYDNAVVRMTVRQCVNRTARTPWIAGAFKWAAFDYLGEASGYGTRHWPLRMGNPGVIDCAGFPKDVYYFFQSQYRRRDSPMVHLLPHWTWPQLTTGTTVPVVAYSNCDQVELLLNGKSLGRRAPRPELLDFVWQVPYVPGELKAVGYRGGQPVATTSQWTAGPGAQLQFTSDPPALPQERAAVVQVTAAVLDAAGHPVPTAADRVDLKLTGPARLLGLENGNPTDVTPNRLAYRDTFAGLLKAYVQPTGEAGDVELCALSVVGDRRFAKSATVAIAFAALPLRGTPRPAVAELHYTLDGSDPSPASPRYEKPIALEKTTSVKVLALRDGRPWLTSAATFEQGPPITWSDPRYEQPAPSTTAASAASAATQPAKTAE